MQFRYATPDDTKYIHQLLLSDPGDDAYKLGLNGFEEDLLKSDSYKVSIIGERNDQVVCFGKVMCSGFTGFSYVSLVYVHPDFRKQGIGLELLKFLEEYALKNWNSAGVELLTISNSPMDSLACKAGYMHSGTYIDRYFLNNKFFDECRWMKVFEGKIL